MVSVTRGYGTFGVESGATGEDEYRAETTVRSLLLEGDADAVTS